ncbi:WD40 repeat domain-containing protein [Virgisporangium ochraceum]|uniref:WD40 repeat, subgroup n=1 Tax=Virgisporangium ochraceum TaxID=65505 RepID=A0A8J3ZV46_9ACTN|nr:hypothetical protein [Virgisporangium ochraceum]GIJ70984.1 hypothetical protein Voc01_059010 [Virgisporangium ochraceum]
MTSLREVEAAAREGTLGDMVDALRSDPLSRWLAKALRVDLAAIVADPARTLQTVWARGYFTPALRGTLDRWREEHAGRPWARALRPPAFPLSGPLEEEYRGDFSGADAVSLTDETVTVVRGDSVTVVDRATGARRPSTAAAGPFWTVDFRTGFGQCRVVDLNSDAVLLDLQVNDEDRYEAVAVAEGGAVFAGGWCYDYDGVVVRIDDGAVRWRWEKAGAHVAGLSCTPDGARVLAFSRGRLFVLDGATGTVVHSGHVGAGVGAVDPAGTRLVTVGDSVARVWTLDRLGDAEGGLPGTGSGFAYAMWSPDGSRLLTGSALCEGTGGRLVAVLLMDGTGYLEGGPPPDARVVGDTEVVEFTPLRGMTMWDAVSGAPVAADPDRRYSLHRDRLWIAPDARSYLHADRDGGARLLRTRDGAELAAFGRMAEAAWSPDSSRFAAASDGVVRVHGADGAVEHDLGTVDDVTGLVFSCDGTVLVAGGKGTGLRLWDTGSGAPLGTATHTGRYPWRPSPDRLALLHGQHGFRARRHPFHARHEAGFMVIEPDDPALPVYRVACDEPLVPDPTGTRWASPTAHVALEPSP